MILRFEKENEKQLITKWRETVLSTNPNIPPYKAKFLLKIQDTRHLIHVIVYVGNTASRCIDALTAMDNVNNHNQNDEYHGFKNWASKTKQKRGNCHFNIACPVPPHTDIFLSLLYDGGVKSWFENRYRSDTNIVSWDNVSRDENGRWRIQIGNLCDTWDLIAPLLVDVEFATDDAESDDNEFVGTIYLLNGRHVRLRRNDQLTELDTLGWNQHQAASGNLLFNCFNREFFYFGKKQQEILNVLDGHMRSKDAIIAEQEAIIEEKDVLIEKLLNKTE